MKDVIGFGALNVDLIYGIDPGLIETEPSRERVGGYEEFESLLKFLEREGKLKGRSGGGSAANTVVALSRMGFSTGYIGKVGNDENGDFLIKSLEEVDTSRILRDDRSGMSISILGEERDRSLLIIPNCNDTLSYDEIDLEYIKETKFLHLTSFIGDIPFEAQRRIVGELPPQVKISFDPGEIYAQRGIEGLLPIMRNSFIIFPSMEEVELLTGKDYKEGSRELLELGPRIVSCTLGKDGSYTLSRDEEIETPTHEVEVVDKTGAGDVYAAGFLAGLLLKKSLSECAELAIRTSELCITGYGRKRYPDRKFLKEL